MTPVQVIRIEIGLVGEACSILSDEEIQYFLTKNNNNTKRAALDAAKTVLFILSQHIHSKAGELETWGSDWFNNYYKSLQMFLKDPSFSFDIMNAMPYAGGISVTDIRSNVDNLDNHVVNVDIGIPTDGEAACSTNTNQQVFKRYPYTF